MRDLVSTDLAGAAHLAADYGFDDRPSRAEYDDDAPDRALCPYTGEPCPRLACADEGCDIEVEETLP